MWGYGVDPPADINPHLAVPARRCQASAPVPATRGPQARLSASPIFGGGNAQVTPIFDLRRDTGQHRCPIARFMPALPQVHGRSMQAA
jgi:hypothetical protein